MVDESSLASEDRTAWERPGAFEVAPGVHRIPLPLPGDALKAVNVYAIRQPDGVVVIDSGWGTADAQETLATSLAQLDLELGDITRFLCTHVHRDHYEGGLRLREQFGSKVALGIGERRSAEYLRNRKAGDANHIAAWMERCGADELAAAFREEAAKRLAAGDRPRWEFPDEWLFDDQVVELADRELRVVATPGHTQGHVVFVDETAGVMFSGDHVLPRITPSIGFESAIVDTPLADFLASLARVRAMPDRAMLPAHGPVRASVHDRVDELLAHHEVRLDASHRAVEGGARTPFEVAWVLPWTRSDRAMTELDTFNRTLAVNETAAHLQVLVQRGLLSMTEHPGDHGPVRHYEPA